MKTSPQFLLATALIIFGTPMSGIAATISNEGAAVPTTDILTGDSTEGDLGFRPIDYTSTKSSARGQSFTIPGDGNFTATAIWLRVNSNEDFGNWLEGSGIHMNILSDPVTRDPVPLATFDYDVSSSGDNLGEVEGGEWLRLELGDQGIILAGNTEYSFLMTGTEPNSTHTLNLTRQKTYAVYTGGSELNGNNDYDIANRDTDPWDDTDPAHANATVAAIGSNLFFYIEGVAGGSNVEAPFAITDLSFDHSTSTATLTWRSKTGTLYAIDESTDLQRDRWFENQDNVPGEDGQTELTFQVLPEHQGLPNLFFRVREQAASP